MKACHIWRGSAGPRTQREHVAAFAGGGPSGRSVSGDNHGVNPLSMKRRTLRQSRCGARRCRRQSAPASGDRSRTAPTGRGRCGDAGSHLASERRAEPAHPPERRHHRQHGSQGRRLREGGRADRRQEDRRRGGRSAQAAGAGAGDRRLEHHHHSRVRRCAPAFVGRAASPDHSGRRHRRVHGDDAQRIRALLSPARHLRRQPDHGARAASTRASPASSTTRTTRARPRIPTRPFRRSSIPAFAASTPPARRRPASGTGSGRRISSACRSSSSPRPTSWSRCGCSPG